MRSYRDADMQSKEKRLKTLKTDVVDFLYSIDFQFILCVSKAFVKSERKGRGWKSIISS